MPEPTEKKPFLGLSLAQLVGGSAASATAALLGSRLGTAGTIAGAALVSVVYAVASAAYTASLRRTKEVVVRTRELLPNGTWHTMGRAKVLPEVPDQPDGSTSDVAAVPAEPETRAAEVIAEEETRSVWRRLGWKPVALAAAVFFVITALLVTGTELVTGTSLSGSSGTTVNHAFHGGDEPKPAKTPSVPPRGSTPATPAESPSGEPSEVPTTGTSEPPPATSTPSEVPSETPSQVPSEVPTP